MTKNLIAALLAVLLIASAVQALDFRSSSTTVPVGAAVGTACGVLSMQTSTSGVANTATTADVTLFSYTMPASTLSANGKKVVMRGWGAYGATANNKKVTLKIDSVQVANAIFNDNTGGWEIIASVVRVSSTAVSFAGNLFAGSHGPSTLTGANTAVSSLDTVAVSLALTGASSTTGAANDVVGYGLEVFACN